VIVYCEGPTEETFVNRILAPEFFTKGVYITASSRGGVSKYSVIKRDLIAWCKSDPTRIVTTMLDYYGLPSDTPGKDRGIAGTVYERAEYIERSVQEDIGAENLIPNIMLHEFEALLFTNPQCFSNRGLPRRSMDALCKIRDSFETPEHINDSPNTAPSKRILAQYSRYKKVLDGYNIAREIGLHEMRAQCKHFDRWLCNIEALGEPR
jgi:hypothetical protein